MSHEVGGGRGRLGMHRQTRPNLSVETLEGRVLLSGADRPTTVWPPRPDCIALRSTPDDHLARVVNQGDLDRPASDPGGDGQYGA